MKEWHNDQSKSVATGILRLQTETSMSASSKHFMVQFYPKIRRLSFCCDFRFLGRSACMSHVAWSVCLCIGHTDELCKNEWADRVAVWGLTHVGLNSEEAFIRWGSVQPLREGALLRVDMCRPVISYRRFVINSIESTSSATATGIRVIVLSHRYYLQILNYFSHSSMVSTLWMHTADEFILTACGSVNT